MLSLKIPYFSALLKKRRELRRVEQSILERLMDKRARDPLMSAWSAAQEIRGEILADLGVALKGPDRDYAIHRIDLVHRALTRMKIMGSPTISKKSLADYIV